MEDLGGVQISERAMLIRISQLSDSKMSDDELYDATRGHWRVGAWRERADLALAVAEGVVREVYSIGSWHPAGTTPSATSIHTDAPPERWEFVGTPADNATRAKYVDRSVKHYFARGNQNPIRYVKC